MKQMKPALPAIQVPGSTPFQKLESIFRSVIAVPKAEIDRREKEWKRQREKKPNESSEGIAAFATGPQHDGRTYRGCHSPASES